MTVETEPVTNCAVCGSGVTCEEVVENADTFNTMHGPARLLVIEHLGADPSTQEVCTHCVKSGVRKAFTGVTS